MLGPKLTSLGKSGSIPSKISTLLRSLCSEDGRIPNDLTTFTHMTSLTLRRALDITNCKLPLSLLELTLDLPKGEIDSLKYPPNLLKLLIADAKFKDLANVEFPPKLVDLELDFCDITLTVGWLKPAQLKKLSLQYNKLSYFKAVRPCCGIMCLSDNKIEEV